MTLILLLLALFIAFAVASVAFGRDSRPIGRSKWGDQHDRGPVARW
jgi:hypothetical protein